MIPDKYPSEIVPERDSNNEILERIPFRKNLIWSSASFRNNSSPRRRYVLIAWSWMAAMIDTLILISMSCVFLIVFSRIVHTPLNYLFLNLTHQKSFLYLYLQILLISSWFYMVLVRSYLGGSIGEWACHLRLGHPEERLSPRYISKIILRPTLILCTGIFILPILSMFLGKDVTGKIIGCRLQSLK